MKETTFYSSFSFPLCPLQECTAHRRLSSAVALSVPERRMGLQGGAPSWGSFLRHAGTLSRESSFWIWLSSLSSFNAPSFLILYTPRAGETHTPKLHMTFFSRQKQGQQTRSSKETEGARTDKNIREPDRGKGWKRHSFYWKQRTGRHTSQKRVLASLLQSEPEVITATRQSRKA